jgi:leucyl aminopeptidase
MGNDDHLLDEVRRAGDRAGERCWPLPLWEEYREQIKSDIADVKNSGGRPAGSITAACGSSVNSSTGSRGRTST